MPRVIHFEISADQPERAIEFYEKVFNWKVQKWDGPQTYWLLMTGEEGQPGINGGLMKRTANCPGTVNSIDVPSVDDYAAKITEHGGQVVVPKMAISGVGYVAYCQDTEGNIFGIFQGDRSAQGSEC
jgi:hypothetical protein